MATKKDFTAANTGRVYSTIENATADTTHEREQQERKHLRPPVIEKRARGTDPTEDEVQTAREYGKTQGRKGVKALRVNMAFTPEVHDYIRVMARVRGETITQFTNHVFQVSMEQNAEIYHKAIDFFNSL